MTKYTQKQLKGLVANGAAIDITNAHDEDYARIMAEEGYLTKIGYSCGYYGANGALYIGHNTGRLYAVCSNSTALYLFG